jgi:methylenetetrahydrofolate dehydrogenase (NADP+)/methenyltetrahydrofolate cyclohydrolase
MEKIDGKAISKALKEEIREEVTAMKANGTRVPHLAAILVGEDGGSQTYVNAKMKACEFVGFKSTLVHYPESVTEEELHTKIQEFNEDETLDGFIVQLPLPNHIDEEAVTMAIDPEKDVDGFHPENLGKMMLGLPTFISATPNGILELLKRSNIPTEGKHCVVIGRSHIVGTPMSILLSRNSNPGNCTVTLAHSRTQNLKALTLSADILVVALGKPGFVTADMVREGAVVIDVGTTRVPDASKKSGFRLSGDVDFETVAPKCAHITPVPGGVGPMTIASLLKNTLLARKRSLPLETTKPA